MAADSGLTKPKLILFDVYETLLDMSELERKVNDLFGSRRGYLFWFEMFMEYCFVDNCTVQFNDFPSIGRATMKMAGEVFGRNIREDDIAGALELLEHLPIHDGVQTGLSTLNDMEYRLAALTNSGEQTVRQRMERTGLISYFKSLLSAEHVKKFKPAKEVYLWAAGKLNAAVEETLLVSAHGWDIAGAVNAGMQAAHIKQSKQMTYPLAPQPHYICKSVIDLADQLAAQYRNSKN